MSDRVENEKKVKKKKKRYAVSEEKYYFDCHASCRIPRPPRKKKQKAEPEEPYWLIKDALEEWGIGLSEASKELRKKIWEFHDRMDEKEYQHRLQIKERNIRTLEQLRYDRRRARVF